MLTATRLALDKISPLVGDRCLFERGELLIASELAKHSIFYDSVITAVWLRFVFAFFDEVAEAGSCESPV